MKTQTLSVLLLLSLLFILVTRFYGIDNRGLWLDEDYSLSVANPSLSFSEMKKNIEGDVVHPNLYYMSLWVWLKIFGKSILSLRSLSVVFGLFGVLAIYLCAREFFNRKVAVYTLFITSVTVKHITMSQEARVYALFYLSTTLSFYLFYKLIKNKKINYLTLVSYIIASMFMLNSHFYAYPLIFSQACFFIFWFLKHKRTQKKLVAILISMFAIFISCIPSLYKISVASKIKKFWIPEKVWHVKIFYLKDFFVWVYVRDWLIVFFSLVLLWSITSFFLKSYKFKVYTRSLQLLSFWILFGFALPLIYSILRVDILFPRYLLGLLPPISILLGVGFSRINQNLVNFFTGIIFLLITGYLLFSKFYATTHLW